jgi:hypothetical protein
MIEVRNLRLNEPIPDGFHTGFEGMPVMCDWVWVAEISGRPAGILLAAPCHGLVYMMRLCVKTGENGAVAAVILRGCMKDCKARGFRGYFFHVSTLEQVERDLVPIVRKAGGVQLPVPQVLMVGPIEKAAKL